MPYGHFVWTDLSTYSLADARTDYADLFGWSFGGDDAYDFAILNGTAVAAVFPMPERLAKIDMPSFWMSYVHVDDLDAAVAKARSHDGVIIEIEPQDFDEGARVALVRDPSGAGFTLYEGPEIAVEESGTGTVTARFHHCADVALIGDFYRDLFGWRMEKSGDVPWPVYDILHPHGTRVARAEEVPRDLRGKFSYWMPCFEVTDRADFLKKLNVCGGAHFSDLTQGQAMVSDRQQAHFIFVEA